MKKRYFALTIAGLITGIFIGCLISNIDINKEYYIPEELEQVEKEVDKMNNTYKGSLSFYQDIIEIEELDIVIYEVSELTMEILESRSKNHRIIIEKCIGEVTSPEGDGKVLNYDNPDDYYINYSSITGVSTGDIILTYFIYNPDTDYFDDVLLRFDYIIDDKK